MRLHRLSPEEESYTLYAKLVVPQGKAVVMCLREFGSTRAIDLCYLRDVGGTFRTSILGETYPLIEVDGTAITDGSHPEITCSESLNIYCREQGKIIRNVIEKCVRM